MSYALSTSWNAARFSQGSGIIGEIKEAGFDEVELSFNLTEKIVKDILRLAYEKKIKVLSLHNYCPIPKRLAREHALPDVYSLASVDEEERKTAVYFTKKSIDYCAKFKAQALVLHCGYVLMQENIRTLIELYSQGLKESQEFTALKNRTQEERKLKSRKYLSQAIKSLEELNNYSQKLGVALGVENRFYIREIPNFEEIGIILAHFRKQNIFYWHDTGHAQVMENLGFVVSTYDFLKCYGRSLIGLHIHDVRLCRDHLAPLKGDLDFAKLKPYISNSILKVIEAHAPSTIEDIINARRHLEQTLGQ